MNKTEDDELHAESLTEEEIKQVAGRYIKNVKIVIQQDTGRIWRVYIFRSKCLKFVE